MKNGWPLLALAGALVLTGCDSGGVPSPAERLQGESAQVPLAANAVELRGDGLAAGAEAFFFAAGQKEVEAAVTKAVGAKMRSGQRDDCGAGSMTFSDFPGGLTAHFQEGRLVGWNWHLTQDGDTPPSGVVQLAGKVQVGTARSAAETAPGFAPVADSTLGEEFALGDKVGGFITSDKVTMLYAGTQCFFR